MTHDLYLIGAFLAVACVGVAAILLLGWREDRIERQEERDDEVS